MLDCAWDMAASYRRSPLRVRAPWAGTFTTVNTPLLLLRAAHAGPAFAVTLLAGLLSVNAEHGAGTTLLVASAILSGQLVIGWSNDLIDARRDRLVARADKPLATGALPRSMVVAALAAAATACLGLSLMLGLAAGLTNLLVCVGGGLAYNLGLKSTAWSWLPYAMAFGALPAVVTLSSTPPHLPAPWMIATGALLGVGAHLVNVLPDLDDDAATGVRGLPHRLGARRAQVIATAVLVLASVVAVVGSARLSLFVAVAVLAVVGGLAVVALRSSGRTPFRAAVAIAVVDVTMLTALG